MTRDLREIAFDVYQYAYPLVILDTTMRQATNVPDAETTYLRAPVNQFAHARSYPAADSRDVVRFNFDTLYSFAWADLRDQPVVLTVPESNGRYYLCPILDMWTNDIAVPGTRTTDGAAGAYVLTAPGWSGQLPDDVEQIVTTTPVVWIMGRTQCNGPADFAAVNAFQDGFTLTPLDAWGTDYTPPRGLPVDPTISEADPQSQIDALSGTELFTRFAELLKVFPLRADDYPIKARMSALGLIPGKEFTPNAELSALVDAAARDAHEDMVTTANHGGVGSFGNGWAWLENNIGNYGVNYRPRAVVAWGGLGANMIDDAVYYNNVADADGDPTDGGRDYVLHFDEAEIPQTDAFWSLTMYDEKGFQVPNPLDRFALGDRDPLTFNPDGSLDLFIQHTSPGPDREPNWLPAPAGRFLVLLRVYSPGPEIVRGRYRVPPVRKA